MLLFNLQKEPLLYDKKYNLRISLSGTDPGKYVRGGTLYLAKETITVLIINNPEVY